MQVPKRKYTKTCRQCKVKFTVESETEPSDLCDRCTIPLLKAVWEDDFETVCAQFLASIKSVPE